MYITFLRPKLVFQLALMIAISACEAITTTHGRLIEPAELDRLELGVTTQAETIAILGPPSFEGAFNSGRLYYNNQKMEKSVGGETLTIERELIIFIFDNNNRLDGIEIRDKTSDKKIISVSKSSFKASNQEQKNIETQNKDVKSLDNHMKQNKSFK